MTVKTTSKVFGIDDIKIYPITEDTETAYTVGDAIDVPGAKNLSIDLEIEEKDLTGDNIVLDVYSNIKKATFNVGFAKLSLELLKAALGGRLVSSGSTPSGKQVFSLQSGDKPSYFQLAAQVANIDEGSLRINIMKCRISAAPLSAVENDFATYSLSGSAVFTSKKFIRSGISAPLLFDISIDETETAPAAINS